MVSATLLATIPWAPDGPLPRSTVPVHLSSARRPGPRLERIAETWTRTLPDGAVCLHARGVLVRSDSSHAVALDPPPGWRLLDAVGDADRTWTIAELVPGPPDVVRLRRLAPDGETLWRTESIAGSADAARELLTDGIRGAVGGHRRRARRARGRDGTAGDAAPAAGRQPVHERSGARRISHPRRRAAVAHARPFAAASGGR